MIAEEEETVFEEGMVIAVEVWVVDWAGTELSTWQTCPRSSRRCSGTKTTWS